ncbi:eCIS core domain-containing protein [Kitasatospora sp. NPDC001660]
MRAHEPDRQADRGPSPAATRAVRPGPRSGIALALQRTIGNAAVTRLVERTRRESGGTGGQDELPLQRSLVPQVLRTAGQPLDTTTRREMESRLGADFSDVRLHTGSTARASAAEVGARAYTSGSHVVLGEGGGDRHTLAHELTHVIQQRQGPVAGTDRGDGLRISDPSDRHEREAEANAVRALSAPLAHGNAGPPSRPGEAVQRMPAKRDADTAGVRGSSPPSGRSTRAKSRAANLDLNRPVLEFRSGYEGPTSQKLHDAQNIGFWQAATLKNPQGAPQRVSTNYHFWQEVTDSNVQIVESKNGFGEHPSNRQWTQDGPYRPPYTNAVIDDGQNEIKFHDNPGFSTSAKMTSGYWLKSYSVSFRWKVARRTDPWNRTMPAWTSPEVTHTLVSEFDPDNPDQAAPIIADPAGDVTWNVDLSTVTTDTTDA